MAVRDKENTFICVKTITYSKSTVDYPNLRLACKTLDKARTSMVGDESIIRKSFQFTVYFNVNKTDLLKIFSLAVDRLECPLLFVDVTAFCLIYY